MTNFEQELPETQEERTLINSTKKLFKRFIVRLKKLAHIEHEVDYDSTITDITASINFKGINIWVLAFAIIVASVGLNMNATAVIIGAMLISPLMGPINGIGLGFGILDFELLKRALRNLGIMVFISIIASTTYFLLSPLNEARSELLARTSPTIFDVLIAFFGGMAGIVASSQKKQSYTVISGVAIATALMPPLCTAGYGLATFQLRYFFGAFYLFFINAFCIALATFLIVRYLHFPYKSYIDPIRQKVVKRTIVIIAAIVVIPSIFMAIQLVRETTFNSLSTHFLKEIQKSPIMENTQILTSRKEFNRKRSSIMISLIGQELNKKEIMLLQSEMEKYGLKKTDLIVKQTESIINANMQTDILEEMLNQKEMQINQKDTLIQNLKAYMLPVNADSTLAIHIGKEMQIQYPFVQTFTINNSIYIDPHNQQTDTIPTIIVTWDKKPNETEKKQMLAWLKIRLDLDTLKLVE